MHTQQRVHRHLHLKSCGGGEVEVRDTCEVDTSVPRWSLSSTHTHCTSNTTDPYVTSTAGFPRSPRSTMCRTRYRTGFPSTWRFQINNSLTSQSERKFLTNKFCTLQNAWSTSLALHRVCGIGNYRSRTVQSARKTQTQIRAALRARIPAQHNARSLTG